MMVQAVRRRISFTGHLFGEWKIEKRKSKSGKRKSKQHNAVHFAVYYAAGDVLAALSGYS
jgi:hypothetical protein